MTPAQSSPITQAETNFPFANSLQLEAGELDALNEGLKRHVVAWRSAHESAVSHLSQVLARMDSILERIERNKA
jgi:hypothetical protein